MSSGCKPPHKVTAYRISCEIQSKYSFQMKNFFQIFSALFEKRNSNFFRGMSLFYLLEASLRLVFQTLVQSISRNENFSDEKFLSEIVSEIEKMPDSIANRSTARRFGGKSFTPDLNLQIWSEKKNFYRKPLAVF